MKIGWPGRGGTSALEVCPSRLVFMVPVYQPFCDLLDPSALCLETIRADQPTKPTFHTYFFTKVKKEESKK